MLQIKIIKKGSVFRCICFFKSQFWSEEVEIIVRVVFFLIAYTFM